MMNARRVRRAATSLLVAFTFAFACGAWTDAEAQRRPAKRVTKRVTKRATASKRRTRRVRIDLDKVVAPVTAPESSVGGPLPVTLAPITEEDAPPPPPKPAPTQGNISGGILNGKAVSKPAPIYPPIAAAARAQGSVSVQVLIDEEGNVVSAEAVSGHPLLRQSAVDAVRQWRFTPTRLSGQPVKVTGVVVVNYVLQ